MLHCVQAQTPLKNRGGPTGLVAAGLALALGGHAAALAQVGTSPPPLRIVGGLAGLNQFTRHEEPFWAHELARLSGGRYRAEIVPFDRAGIRAVDMLALVRRGSVPFGSVSLDASAPRDPELAAADLPGLNPDIAALRRSVSAFRPSLEALLRERYDIEVLTVYTYPAQVLFCKEPWRTLNDLKGRRIRTSNLLQANWVEALGAVPLSTGFAEIAGNLRNGNIDCAITGTMSGNTIGLHELTTHVHSMAVNWGLTMFVANGAAWRALPEDLQALIRRELPRLERNIWSESDRETAEGIACNTGGAGCTSGRAGRMTEVRPSAADLARSREIFAGTVLPRWLQRCGAECAALWNRTMATLAGVRAATN